MHFKAALVAGLSLLASMFGSGAHAGPGIEALKTCVLTSISQNDKRETANWMFNLLALNSSVSSLTSIPDARRVESNKAFARIFGRLATVDCRSQMVAALREDKDQAGEVIGRVLGEKSMTILMEDPAVQKGAAAFAAYIDTKGFAEVVLEAEYSKPGAK